MDADNQPSTQKDSSRGVFNTGVEFSFKASQLWSDATNSFFQVNGLRHIIEPSCELRFCARPQRAARATATVRQRIAEPDAVAREFPGLQQH